VRDIKPTPWRLLRSLQAVLWAVLVLCVGNALAYRTVNPLDLPLADTADTAKTRAVAEAKSAEILALEEMAESAGIDVGEKLRTPYSYGGNRPLSGADSDGKEWRILLVPKNGLEPTELVGTRASTLVSALNSIGPGEILKMKINGHGNSQLQTLNMSLRGPAADQLMIDVDGVIRLAIFDEPRTKEVGAPLSKDLFSGKFAKGASMDFEGCEITSENANLARLFSVENPDVFVTGSKRYQINPYYDDWSMNFDPISWGFGGKTTYLNGRAFVH